MKAKPAPVHRPPTVFAVGEVFADWTGDARFYEYTKAANPIGSGHTPSIPIRQFSAQLHQGGNSQIVALDLSAELGIFDGAATSPALCASFIHILAGERLATAPVATSELYYVIRGQGFSAIDGELIRWHEGDVFVLPGNSRSTHHAGEDSAMYWITDAPLLRYLGVSPTARRFRATMFTAQRIRAELDAIATDPKAKDRNRLSVLLAGVEQPQTLTATHVLWAMYGLLPVAAVQRPHRHQSVALDLIVDCQPGCYSLVGNQLDQFGEILNPKRVDWEPGGAFVTPPGLWHAHYNESGHPAHLLPIQDAGLQTYLRSLDIRFAPNSHVTG
ncbi:MAG: cupin [Methylococcales bacterium]